MHEKSTDTPWITYKNFQDLCRPRKVSHELAALYARMINQLGYIIHYGREGDDNSQGLGQYMILWPDYLARAISFVLDDQTTRDRHGLVTHERLSRLWRPLNQSHSFRTSTESKLAAGHNPFHKLRQATISFKVVSHRIEEWQVTHQFLPPEGIGQQLSAQCRVKLCLLRFEILMQPVVSGDLFAAAEDPCWLDAIAVPVFIPPASERIEVLQREPQRIDP